MYTVEVRTAILTGDNKIHSWLHITRPDGTTEAWGFHPDTDSLGNYTYGPGDIRAEDPGKEFSGTSEPLEISEEQYNLLKSYIEISDVVPPDYSLFSLPPAGLQCSTWTLVALNQIGVVPSTMLPEMVPFIGSLIWHPGSVPLMIDEIVIAQSISDLFNAAYNMIRRRDPLVLDLDGDGIETVGASSSNPILFDHDNDGIRTGTGWVAPDDALLVLDRNGNGAIDNGGELFGDSTTLGNGALAFDGFAALADMDGNADGVVNASDAQFANLRVWRDFDQDGISQSGELSTLGASGIESISVAHTEVAQTQSNGNTITAVGTYSRTDGSTATVGSTNLGDANLVEDTFHREFTDTVPLAPGVAVLLAARKSQRKRNVQVSAAHHWRMAA